jgi:hypothetical protein
MISEAELVSLIAPFVRGEVKPIAFPTTGGCPVHAMGSSVQQFISVLDLRKN